MALTHKAKYIETSRIFCVQVRQFCGATSETIDEMNTSVSRYNIPSCKLPSIVAHCLRTLAQQQSSGCRHIVILSCMNTLSAILAICNHRRAADLLLPPSIRFWIFQLVNVDAMRPSRALSECVSFALCAE